VTSYRRFLDAQLVTDLSFFLLLFFVKWCFKIRKSFFMSNLITTTDAQVKDEISQADQPVLLYFWASWCGPCRLVSPSVEAVAQEYAEEIKVLKLEVDPNPETVKTYQVEGVPALRLVAGDSVRWSHEGAITKDKLKESLDRCLKQ